MIEKKKDTPLKKKKKNTGKKKRSSWNKIEEGGIAVTDNRKTLQNKLLKEEAEEDNIVKAHLKTLENHTMTIGMRTEKVAFAIFLGLPEAIRGTQSKFSEEWGISEQTLSAWKYLPEIQKLRMVIMKSVLIERTPAVMENLYNAASKANSFGSVNVGAVKLWLQFVEEWKEASTVDLNATGGFQINFGAGKSQFINPTDEQPLKESEKQ